MTHLNKGRYIGPFWGSSNNYSTGRDPLGLQSTSQAAYSILLPGLTNLTNRLRYYGFYCWLLDEYDSRINKQNYKKQNQFIRRAEYMIALIMNIHSPDSLQISGSKFAASELKKLNDDDFYDLAFGADLDDEKHTYWKYPSGAFGQYYAGAMQTIGLISNVDGFLDFMCTKRDDVDVIDGTSLSMAFSKSINVELKDLFIKNILDGRLYKRDSKALFDAFSIDFITPKSEEWVLYNKMLFSIDFPTRQNFYKGSCFRKDSIEIILSYINDCVDPKKWRFFLYEIYHRKGEDHRNIKTDASIGWYYYQLNEFWHYGLEIIFWAVLTSLSKDYFAVSVNDFLNDFVNRIISNFKKNNLISDDNEILSSVIDKNSISDEFAIINAFQKAKKIDDIDSAIILGFKLLFKIFKSNNSKFDDLNLFGISYEMERDGDFVNGLNVFSSFSDISFSDFLRQFLLKNIINRHLDVAYRKMGSGLENSLKFNFEDNLLKHIETVEPVWTSPRLFALYSFFKDLSFVDRSGCLTSIGKEVIE